MEGFPGGLDDRGRAGPDQFAIASCRLDDELELAGTNMSVIL